MAAPGECLEHVTLRSRELTWATPAHSRSREVLYSTITQAGFYEKQEAKQMTKLDYSNLLLGDLKSPNT